jgi:hypothetical protein
MGVTGVMGVMGVIGVMEVRRVRRAVLGFMEAENDKERLKRIQTEDCLNGGPLWSTNQY